MHCFRSIAVAKLDVFLSLENIFIESKIYSGSGVSSLTNGGFKKKELLWNKIKTHRLVMLSRWVSLVVIVDVNIRMCHVYIIVVLFIGLRLRRVQCRVVHFTEETIEFYKKKFKSWVYLSILLVLFSLLQIAKLGHLFIYLF